MDRVLERSICQRNINLYIPSLKTIRLLDYVRRSAKSNPDIFADDIISLLFELADTDVVRVSFFPSFYKLWLISNRDIAIKLLNSGDCERYHHIGGYLSITGHHGVATSHGALWRTQRDELSPYFAKPYLLSRLSEIDSSAHDALSQELETAKDTSCAKIQIEADSFFRRVAFKTSCDHVGIGLDGKVTHMFGALIQEGLSRMGSPAGFLDLALGRDTAMPQNSRTRPLIAKWKKVLYAAIEQQLAPAARLMEACPHANTLAGQIFNRYSPERETRENYDKIAEEIFQILYASYETTASLLGSAAHYLARNLEVQKRCKAESLRLRNLGELLKSRLFDDLFSEMLTTYPSIPFLPPRIVRNHVKLQAQGADGRSQAIAFDPGDTFIVPISYLQKRSGKKLAFGAGAHACPGQILTRITYIAVLSKLLRRYEITAPAPVCPHRVIHSSLVAESIGDDRLILENSAHTK